MQPAPKQQLWDKWLCSYWQDRLQGVLVPLAEVEIRNMLDWLPRLGDAYPEAALLAIQTQAIQLAHSRLLYDLGNTDLVTRYQDETAQLVIDICSRHVGYHAAEISAVAARLTELEPKAQHGLDEALARAGASRF